MADFQDTIALPETRTALERLIEAAIARLDDMDGDPDLEPTLGAPSSKGTPCVEVGRWMEERLSRSGDHYVGELYRVPMLSQAHWAEGSAVDETEEVCEDEGAATEDEGSNSDAEPSLGSLELDESHSQTDWAMSGSDDREAEARAPTARRNPRDTENRSQSVHVAEISTTRNANFDHAQRKTVATSITTAFDDLHRVQRRQSKKPSPRPLIIGDAIVRI